jgi:hypothetical protein
MGVDSYCVLSGSVSEPAIESSSISELLKASSQSLAMLLLKCRSSSLKISEAYRDPNAIRNAWPEARCVLI